MLLQITGLSNLESYWEKWDCNLL